MQHIMRLTIAVFGAAVLSAQTAEIPTHFEVASVKISSASDNLPGPQHGFGRQSGGPGSSTPGQYTATGISLKNILFGSAYRFDDYQYVAPSWMANSLIDVAVKVPPGITRDQFMVMLQNLLIERFRIEFHHEQREHNSADLVIAKGGLKMKPSKFDENAQPNPGPGPGGTFHLERNSEGFPVIPADSGPMTFGTGMNGQFVLVTNRSTVKQLVDTLSRNLHLPIVDKTGLTGTFAFLLHFAPEGASAPETLDVAPTPFDALQSQLGLKLELHKALVDVLVIDRAEKTPIEN
jgi:uncharacterized protein (TIGR03435 family)